MNTGLKFSMWKDARAVRLISSENLATRHKIILMRPEWPSHTVLMLNIQSQPDDQCEPYMAGYLDLYQGLPK